MAPGHAEAERRSRPESGPEAPSDPLVRSAPVTLEGFSASFERCFGRVYSYVSRRVNDPESCKRIVSEVLAANIDLLVNRGDERQELCQLKASSDRLIGLESARSLSTGTIGPEESVMKVRIPSAISGLAFALFFAGCGTVIGAAVGAGTGGAVGAATGYGAGKGALIGTGVGAVAGAIYDITQHDEDDEN